MIVRSLMHRSFVVAVALSSACAADTSNVTISAQPATSQPATTTSAVLSSPTRYDREGKAVTCSAESHRGSAVACPPVAPDTAFFKACEDAHFQVVACGDCFSACTGRVSRADCGVSARDWCTSASDGPCGAHPDEASCRLDAHCKGMPYRGESVVPCNDDRHGFSTNCPTVGCISR